MQIGSRLSNTHPDKLLSTLQRHIDAGHGQSALQAIPDLQLSHPQFHNELERIQRELSDNLLADVKVLDKNQAEIFRCLNCGAGLARQSPETVYVICQYCGNDAEHPATDRGLQRWDSALDLEANFTIGDFFQYKGKRWQSVGVQLFSGRVREHDGEEEGWQTNFARYTNWWMLNEQRELAWLVDDGRRRYWAGKHMPDNPSVPSVNDTSHEHGDWALEFAAGEFSYQPTSGEQHLSAESKVSRVLPGADEKQRYYVSVESRHDENGDVKEIEFFKSRMIPHAEVLEGLGKNLELSDVNRWRNTMRALMFGIPLLFASMFYWNRGDDKSVETIALAKEDANVVMHEFVVDKPGQTIEMRGAINGVRNNSWFGVDLSLVNSDNEDVYGKYLEFWHESGRDSDGAWSERSLSSKWYVRMDEPDTYRVVINGDAQSTSPDADFRLSMVPNRVSSTPFLLAGIFCLALVVLSRSKMSSVRTAASSIALKVKKRLSEKKNNGAAQSTDGANAYPGSQP